MGCIRKGRRNRVAREAEFGTHEEVGEPAVGVSEERATTKTLGWDHAWLVGGKARTQGICSGVTRMGSR